MNQSIITQPFSRVFPKAGTRFLCQFRERGKDTFTSDCAYDELDMAVSYVCLVVRFVRSVAEGKVFDSKTNQLVLVCQMLVDIPPKPDWRIREAPADYSQLALLGFDPQNLRKSNFKQKKKVEETLAKLRQLHDELNAQLYARPAERPTIHSPGDAADLLQPFIGYLDHEELWVVNLDTRNRVMSLIGLYKGSVNSSQVRVAEVFRQAITDNAPSIIVGHNHPSGDISPSPDDIAVTRSIVEVGKLIDIAVLDHIIVGAGRYASLKERGLGF